MNELAPDAWPPWPPATDALVPVARPTSPPLTVESPPAAAFWNPPSTACACEMSQVALGVVAPPATLSQPPNTLENGSDARLPWPPEIAALRPLAWLPDPPVIDAKLCGKLVLLLHEL